MKKSIEAKRTPKPDNFQPESTLENGSKRCKAWSPKKGRQCRNHPLRGKEVCRFHGGKAGRHPQAIRFSLAGKLKSLAAQVGEDENIFNLRSEAVISSVRIQELLEQIGFEKAMPDVDDLRHEVNRAIAGVIGGDRNVTNKALKAIEKMLDPLEAEKSAWEEIRQHLALSERISRSERVADFKGENLIPLPVVIHILTLAQQVFYRYLPPDEKTRRDAAMAFRDLWNREHIVALNPPEVINE